MTYVRFVLPATANQGSLGPLAPTILLLQVYMVMDFPCRKVVGGHTRATMGATVSFDRMAPASLSTRCPGLLTR